jgi:hypothetical protein
MKLIIMFFISHFHNPVISIDFLPPVEGVEKSTYPNHVFWGKDIKGRVETFPFTVHFPTKQSNVYERS